MISPCGYRSWRTRPISQRSHGDFAVLAHRRSAQNRCKSKKRAAVKEKIEAVGATLRFLPPHSPDFNPIEKAFSRLKAMLRKAGERIVRGLRDLIGRLVDIFQLNESANYFRSCGYEPEWWETALNRATRRPGSHRGLHRTDTHNPYDGRMGLFIRGRLLRTFAVDATLPIHPGYNMMPSSQMMSVAEQRRADLSGLRHRTSQGNLTCFVGFYGLNRSLRWTAPSIERNILLPLREFGFHLRMVAHLNLPHDITNARTREKTAPSSKWPLSIPLELCWIEPQSESLCHIESRGHGLTIFESSDSIHEYQNRRNLALQLHSLNRLWGLCSLLKAESSDLFVLLRPDLEYVDRLDVPQIYESISKRGVDLITPEWQQWDGLNDRFAFCSARGAATYCQRLNQAHEHIIERGGDFHAETFLKWAAERNALHLDLCKLRAMRVRSTGKTWREGFELDIATNLRALTRAYRHRVWSWLKP